MRTLACGVGIGSFLVLVGALAIGLVPWMVHNGIRDLVKMETPSSPLYESFKNSSAKGVHVYKTFYLYHVKNPWDASMGVGPNLTSVPPDVELLGPFTVREFETYNESVSRWLPNATFRYRSFTTYEPVSGDFDQVITTPQLSVFAFRKALGLVDRILHNNPEDEAWVDWLVNLDIHLHKGVTVGPLFVNKTVREILWGYDDPLADFLATTFGKTPAPMALNADTNATDYATGATEDECYTGGDPSNTSPPVPENSYRWMTMWHNIRVADYWGTVEANTIAGTDATAFHAFIKKGEALLVWVNSLLRKVYLTYQKEVVHRGITTYRHIIDPAALDASNPENGAYFMTNDGWIPSPPNVTTMPVNFTKALYLDADKSIVDVTGMPEVGSPEWPRESVDTFLDIEPLTGTLVNVHKRIQVSVDLNQFKWAMPTLNKKSPVAWEKIKVFAHAHPTYLPVFFLDQHMSLPDKIINDLKKAIFIPLLLSKVLGGLAVAIGAVVVIASIVVRILAVRREERNYQSHEFYHLVNDDK
uniref:CD36 family protein n=1 Tax=Neobodo designis TaxID=312471 RepID=A0A7S1M9M7_NEODS|mmetsp:Transcript_36767/g.113403  ORF Transcript_36767/g.113403 Transcript_36767/m.113403 type:complete len:530 (+) Transcript_36767:100-1689(+)|eukprot:CAMPEP_0174850828 /NCGR_PEP_ID=MMETSP1114-20130205/21158_1 /TAXON_ID=312471 /ORGANISM="Neobodo designis, Strain CCAP 1951/1" /LENGTH=529 /DNA_ID=CAMNT_0016085315 /DNA_START=100 /DNA_END=1689 /DNA_ORIENTATION=+